MNNLYDVFLTLLIVIGWLAGIAIASAKGTLMWAIFVAPYAWYLVIEKIMIANNFI